MTTELYLIPNTTQGNTAMQPMMDLSEHYKRVLPELDGVLAESLAGGRKWLKMIDKRLPVIAVDHRKLDQLQYDLEQIKGGKWAYVTDAGYPCIADPGAVIVKIARSLGYTVHLLPGTSAIVAAIALSGLSSQRFAFHGYLPKEPAALKEALKELEAGSAPKDESWQGASLQAFIEVPHRFKSMVKSCLEALSDSTWLGIACEVANTGQDIQVKRVRDWKKEIAQRLEKGEETESCVAVFLVLNEEKRSSFSSHKSFDRSSSKREGEGKKRGKSFLR